MEEGKQKLTPRNLDHEQQAAAALYALGALSHHEARVFEEQLAEAAPDRRQELASFDRVVVALALGVAEQAPAPALRAALLARIAAEAEAQQSAPATRPESQFINLRAGDGHWAELGPGLQVKRLFVDQASGTVTALYRFAPGTQVPRHRHLGPEQCYVLAGDFRANELCFGAGDLHVALPGSVHETISSQTGALVLIVAPENYELL